MTVFSESDDPNSLRGMSVGETVLLRREMDRDTRERLRALEQRQDAIEHKMDQRLSEIAFELRHIADRQNEQGPTLAALSKVVNSGLALRWLMVSVVGLIAALATILTAYETLKKWMP